MGSNNSSSRLKVLHLLVTMPVGGAEDLVANIVTGLNPARFKAAVACIGPLGPVGRELQAQGHEVLSLGLDIKHTPAIAVVRAVRRLLQGTVPDILHTHLYHPNLFGRLAAVGLGVPGVVAAVHNSYTQVKFHRRMWNFLLARVTDRILVGSRQVYDEVRRLDGVPKSRLRLMPYGIPLRELAPAESYDAARAKLGVSGFVVGMVGRLEEQKGHRYLIAALPELAREIAELTVLLVGEGRRQEALHRQVQELGLESRVRFLGTRRDLPLIYRALDLLVHPSLWEGLPLALLQAMGAGLPVVATRVSGVRDVITEGVNGLLAPPGDSQALALRVRELYLQPARRACLAEAARRTIEAGYSLEAMLKQLEELYLELGQKGRSCRVGL